ncbi:hypothetical protein ACP4OV_001982 [Aristida adscensionis]
MAGVPPPPRQLEVRRFAAARAGELRSLHAAVSARLDAGGGRRAQQPRSARRRTTGHLPSKRRRRSGDGDGEAARGKGEEEGSAAPRKLSRRVRRRRELAGNPAEGFSVAGDGARRLRTHLWHAKRFAMERRWGFVLPVGAHGRGRGSRSVLKRLKNGTVIHDASYFVPIELDGPEDSLLSILGMIMCPSPADKTTDPEDLQDQVMRGVCYENAMLCDIGTPHSQIVGPVTYMWRPFLRENGELVTEGDLSNSHSFDEERNSSMQRQLWIWIHPAGLDEGLNAIRSACERQMQGSGGVVKCCSLEGKFARLEVMGSKAMKSLYNILHPIINSSATNMVPSTSNMSTSTDGPMDSSTVSHLSKASLFDHAEILHPGAIISMVVHDPRDGSGSKLVPLNKENIVLKEGLISNADKTPLELGNILSWMRVHPGRHDMFLADCKELWDSSNNINPPLAEEILCTEKHHERIKFFCLDSGNDQGQTNQEKDFSRSCPVVLLKHAREGMLALGMVHYSTFELGKAILALSSISWCTCDWFKRETVDCDKAFKIPCFPYDYPDSKAYSSFMAREAAVFDKAVECRPASKRPPRVHMAPSWHCIMAYFHKGDGIVRGPEVDDIMQATIALPKYLGVNSISGKVESSQSNIVASLQIFVPRTIQTLKKHVKEFDMKYLSSSDMETDTDKSNLSPSGTVKMTCSVNLLCLTRVLIRAFKEGSFEEGAVICAPFPSDLSAWEIRSEEEEEESEERWELQLPQSHVGSYFSWLDPSTSSLQLPEDNTAREAFRWPIGFVTTGFIHGSSGQDAVAVGFCEAKLLALLRRQQWMHENLQTREICVLVRNARSSAYRRAFATIVLEQQKEDLEFL